MTEEIDRQISLYWDNVISREEMLKHLNGAKKKNLVEWIDNIVNRVPEAMNFTTREYRLMKSQKTK